MKPENLLFKDKTHTQLTIADFGEAGSFADALFTTYCGTPDYMAPEVIKGKTHQNDSVYLIYLIRNSIRFEM